MLEETVELWVVCQHFLQERQQDGDGNRVEIVVDVEFVGPHALSLYGLVDVGDGIVGFHAAAEGVAIRGKMIVVFV